MATQTYLDSGTRAMVARRVDHVAAILENVLVAIGREAQTPVHRAVKEAVSACNTALRAADEQEDSCTYCGAPPPLQEAGWVSDHSEYFTYRHHCPACGATMVPVEVQA